MNISFDVSGLTQYAGTLEEASARVEGLASRVVQKVATDVQAMAQTRAPVDTGALRSSIGVDGGGLQATIGPSVNYGIYQELGTSRMAPQPFLFPSLEAKTPVFLQAMEAVAERALQ